MSLFCLLRVLLFALGRVLTGLDLTHTHVQNWYFCLLCFALAVMCLGVDVFAFFALR
jgi:hypothetical protein